MPAYHDLLQRFEQQEAALLALLDRVQCLERSLAFESSQREFFERLVIRLGHLPKRMDRIEALHLARGRGSRPVKRGVE